MAKNGHLVFFGVSTQKFWLKKQTSLEMRVFCLLSSPSTFRQPPKSGNPWATGSVFTGSLARSIKHSLEKCTKKWLYFLLFSAKMGRLRKKTDFWPPYGFPPQGFAVHAARRGLDQGDPFGIQGDPWDDWGREIFFPRGLPLGRGTTNDKRVPSSHTIDSSTPVKPPVACCAGT